MVTVDDHAAQTLLRLAAMLPVTPALLADQQIIDLVEAIEDAGRVVDGLRLVATKEVDNRCDPALGDDSLAKRLGQRTVAGALEQLTRTSHGEAFRRVKTARNLAKLPAVERAAARGDLGREQAEAIIAPLAPALNAADPRLLDAAQRQLLELTGELPADAVEDAARLWASALDPDGVKPREELAMQRRYFTIGRDIDGLAKVSGLLPTEQAATIRAVLDAYANPRTKRTVEFSPAGGTASDEPRDPRTPGQKRADVVHAVFAAQARDAGVPTMGSAHPTLIVTTTKAELETERGCAEIDGAPISMASAKRIACTGGTQSLVFGDDGEVLYLGRSERFFTAGQRRAIAVRDKRCVIPGCSIPARWCEVHHVIAARDGGATDIDNGVLLCWFHHQNIDDGPWRIRMVKGRPEIRWLYGEHGSPWMRAVSAPPPRT